MATIVRSAGVFVLLLGVASCDAAGVDSPPPPAGAIRVATYNIAMYRDAAGELRSELETGESKQAKRVAEVLQRVRPDVVLLNEFDYEEKPDGEDSLPRELAERYLAKPQAAGLSPLDFPTVFYEPVNTGVDSGHDLDHDGRLGGPADALGYGRYPGQYGMVLFARFPSSGVQTFREVLWKDLPGALLPVDPKTGEAYYTDEELRDLRLPSKTFMDCGVWWPAASATGKPTNLRLLCSHPTPPVFDGPEDRNGRRNFDEIRLVAQRLSDSPLRSSPTVVLGDLNADPVDGDSYHGAIQQLLDHPRIDASFVPESDGGAAASAARPDLNATHRGDPAHDTADFSGDDHGNLRVDYVLPSRELRVVGGGVYWPNPGEPGHEAAAASDHRLVWVDVVRGE